MAGNIVVGIDIRRGGLVRGQAFLAGIYSRQLALSEPKKQSCDRHPVGGNDRCGFVSDDVFGLQRLCVGEQALSV